MTLDPEQLATELLKAMAASLSAAAPAITTLATGESLKLATTLAQIQTMVNAGQIDHDQAAILLDMQKHASRAVLLSVEGISLIIAEQAINAGLKAISAAVNGAVGFTLL